VLLVLSPNLIRILLGWDGLGLVSYCLVIYYQNMKSAAAGILTVLSNRVGDVAILLCISWMFNFGSWNFFYLQYMYTRNELLFVLFLIVLAAMTKRAQIPFSAWLPAAIAAPTPVSALVHSSTLVTAGVYLLIRFHELVGVRCSLLIVSVLTLLISGVGASFSIDLKKIIALSTLSQLGVIIITISLGLVELSYFHLIRHALFKSLLFLCAGVYIHSYGDIQDIRDIAGVGTIKPLTRLFFIGCSLSLCGFPFLSGFYSKDLILELFIELGVNRYLWGLVVIGTIRTFFYSTRLIYYIFIKGLGLKKIYGIREEVFILFPMAVLFVLSTMRGSIFSW
jgi:NADH-ubiquinone oxidoreductase chain 5